MNKSERIRSLISSPKTAAEIHTDMPDVPLPLIRGLIQTMITGGLAHRIGDKRPYQYKVGRGLETHNRGKDLNITQQVRACIRHNGPISADRIAIEIGIKVSDVRKRITEMKKRKFIEQDANGCYVFLRESKNPPVLTRDERKEKARKLKIRQRQRQRALRESKRPAQSTPMTVVSPKGKPEPKMVKTQTVEDWLAKGGIIDRSPTPLPFERLSRADIDTAYRANSMPSARNARSYLAA